MKEAFTLLLVGTFVVLAAYNPDKDPNAIAGARDVTVSQPPPTPAADSARITGAYVAGKPHSPVVTGFSANYLCEYHTSVYNAAPGAVATVIWNTGFQDAVVPNDVLHVETPHDGSTWTYKIRVTAVGLSDVYSPDLNVTGYLTGAYPRC